jgi:hypothetical protein
MSACHKPHDYGPNLQPLFLDIDSMSKEMYDLNLLVSNMGVILTVVFTLKESQSNYVR